MKYRFEGARAERLSAFRSYVLNGHHAFLACDEEGLRHRVITEIQTALTGQISETVECGDIESLSHFSRVLGRRLERLVSRLGFRDSIAYRCRSREFGIAADLDKAMEFFGTAGRQGYLILNGVDRVVNMQRTIEVEGPLRSVMQLKSNIALVLSGSNGTIDMLVGDSRRPFYMSFRVFRFTKTTSD